MGYGLVQEITSGRPSNAGPEWWLLLDLALDASDTTRRTAPGYEFMAKRTGAPRSTIYRWLGKLRTAGRIRVVQHAISGGVSGGKGKRAVYEIVTQEDSQAKVAADTLARQGRMILADTATGYMTGFPVVSAERGDELAEMHYADYLLTPEWKARRQAVLEWAAQACQVCCRKDRLHVHHRTYVRRGVERPSDLIVLCADCHGLFHGKLPASLPRSATTTKGNETV
jgi:hypothetical protein